MAVLSQDDRVDVVGIAGNGEEAVKLAMDLQPDVILMDIQMPGMDGVTAATRIRAREAETGRRRTPIVALTANAMSHQIEEYLAAGMDGLIAKPIRVEELFAALQSALDESDEEAAA